MKISQRTLVIFLLLILSAGLLFAYSIPNGSASENPQMVAVFEPDESAPLPYLLDMLKPADSIKQSLVNFIFYDYYFYGFPYFAASAVSLLPVNWWGTLENTSLVMLILRQVISVLPMLLTIWLLTGVFTGYQDYRAVVLFVFLASIPGVVRNNFWWHPDSLAILIAMGMLLALWKDNLRFGKWFYVSAGLAGLAAMTKGIGFYFFLGVGLALLMGLLWKKAPLWKLALSAFGYLAVMAVVYFVSNPIIVINSGARQSYFEIMQRQSELLSQGYEVVYATGWQAAYPAILEYYGHWLFLLAMIGACVWMLWRSQSQRWLGALIIAWSIPLTAMVLFFSHFKFQYWLPVALPLFASLATVLPEKITWSVQRPQTRAEWIRGGLSLGILAIALLQWISWVQYDVQAWVERSQRQQTNPSIVFGEALDERLADLPAERTYGVYHDVRMYVPRRENWLASQRFETLDYAYIQQYGFEIVMIMEQRIRDYLNENAVGIDAASFAEAQRFYGDADAGQIEGYELYYRDDYGLIFIRQDLFDEVFAP